MNSANLLQRGQVLLIVILIMVVALTVGLSVVARTITSLRTSREDETSQRAFSAAEAGVEKIINSSSQSVTGNLTNNSSFSTSVSSVQGATLLVNNGNPVTKDDGADVWLSTYPTYASPFNGTITVYWGKSGEVCSTGSNNTQAALEVVALTGTVATPVIRHYMYDPCNARASLNNFSTTIQPGATVNGVVFARSVQVAITNGLIMRIIPLYASASIGISGNGTSLPAQGQIIQSTGTSGNTTRKITVFKGYPRLPVEFFPSLIFSH